MFRLKSMTSAAVVLMFALGQVLVAQAAPLADPLVGTIDNITEDTDTGGNPVIVVVYTDTDGLSQTRELSFADAITAGLIGPTSVSGAVDWLVGATDPINLTILEPPPPPDPCEVPEGGDAVGGALTGFFCGGLGVDYTMIMGWFDAGSGFGVMTQALFMAQVLGGDAALAEAILLAKTSHDYSALISDWGVPEGISNWGQLKKWVLAGEVKSLTNLGAIMSGRAQPPVIEPAPDPTTTTITTTSSPATDSSTNPAGKAKGKSDQSNGNSNGNGNGNSGGNGNGNGNANGKAKGKSK